MASPIKFVLVTGATGFIGAHVVDTLLTRGLRVRAAARSMSKAEKMSQARPQYKDQLEFVEINDFENDGDLAEATRDVDAIIHTASPFTYNTTNNEKELILPAMNGIRAVLAATATVSQVQRVVITSSFAAVVDINRKAPPYFTYTASDWSPLSYETSIDPETDAVVAYRGSKKFAEQEAWNFVREQKPGFDIVTLCPPMTFGPMVHSVSSKKEINESNLPLREILNGKSPLPQAGVPFWVDVRDLATAHVEAALRKVAGGKRYTVASPKKFSYSLAADIMVHDFPDLQNIVNIEDQVLDDTHGLDGKTAERELGFQYRTFQETIHDFVSQAQEMKN